MLFFWPGGFLGGGCSCLLMVNLKAPTTKTSAQTTTALLVCTTSVLLLYYYGTTVLLPYSYGTTVLLLYYYCTTAHYQGSDLVDCGGECRLEGKVFKMKGW